MGVFAYKGRNGRGDLVEGTLDGSDSGVIADQLINTGIIPVEITPFRSLSADLSKKPDWIKRLFTEKPITQFDVMLFSRQMYTMLKAGIPIMRALAGLQESSQNPTFVAMLQDMRESLDSGRELSAALRRHPKVFTPFYVSMVQIGEMTGMLDETFMRLYDHLAFEIEMKDRIKAAMRYPSFVVMAMVIAVVVINLFVIPAFAKVYAGFHAELPMMTKLLIGFSGFMVDYWLLMLAAAVALMCGFAFTSTPRTTGTDTKIPVAGKIIPIHIARFARSMALSFGAACRSAGMNVVSMVVDNEFMRRRIEQMRDGVGATSILRGATAAGVFNPLVLQHRGG